MGRALRGADSGSEGAGLSATGSSVSSDRRAPSSRLRLIADLLFIVTWRDIKIKYKQSVMGLLWAILMPGLIIAAGLLVQLGVSQLSGRPFTLDTLAASRREVAAVGLRRQRHPLRDQQPDQQRQPPHQDQLPADRVSAVGGAVGAVRSCWWRSCRLSSCWQWSACKPALTQLWAIPLLVLLVLLFVAGLGIAFSAANLYFRDVKYIVEVLLTFAIFFTPVFYSSELFGPWRDWILLNPVAPLLEGLEQAVVQRAHARPGVDRLQRRRSRS